MDKESEEYCHSVVTDNRKLVAHLTNFLATQPTFLNNLTGEFIAKQIDAAKLCIFYYSNLKRIDQLKTSKHYAELMHKTVIKLMAKQDELISLFKPEMVTDDTLTIEDLLQAKDVYEKQFLFLNGLLATTNHEREASMQALKDKMGKDLTTEDESHRPVEEKCSKELPPVTEAEKSCEEHAPITKGPKKAAYDLNNFTDMSFKHLDPLHLPDDEDEDDEDEEDEEDW